MASIKDSTTQDEMPGTPIPRNQVGRNKPATPMDEAIQRRMAKNSSSSAAAPDTSTDTVNKRKQFGY